MIRPFFIAIAVLSGSPVLAGSPVKDPLPMARVSYADLNLGMAAGRATLEKRVERAIHQVCPEAEVAEPARIADMMHCRAAARRNAVVQIARAEVERGQATQLALAGR